jgi:membrane protein
MADRERLRGRILSLPGLRQAQRKAAWGRQKYAGSSAEYLWHRLNALDFINLGMLFAATLLLCFIPFLIVGSALAGRSITTIVARHSGMNDEAASAFGHLFASSSTTYHAVVGTVSVVFFVLGGIAATTALQQLYERVFNVRSRGLRDMWRRLVALLWLLVAGLFSGWAGPPTRHAVGPVLFGLAGVAWATVLWWVMMGILVGGRISWRQLFPSAFATSLFYVGMVAVFSLFFSDMVISEDKEYGPIGLVFALMTYLIALGVVIVLGAVAGLVWQERSLAEAPLFRRLRRHR